jgi:hypothetical protein
MMSGSAVPFAPNYDVRIAALYQNLRNPEKMFLSPAGSPHAGSYTYKENTPCTHPKNT